jgi:ABC-type spermidine/putrescine transport system permease subunit II
MSERGRARLGKWLVSGPPLLYLLLFFAIPTLIMVLASFRTPGEFGGLTPLIDEAGNLDLNVDSYARFFSEPVYAEVFLKSVGYALVTTLACLLLAYPLAVLIATASKRHRNLLLLLVILPFWSNFLIRIYAWMIILGPQAALARGSQRRARGVRRGARCRSVQLVRGAGLPRLRAPAVHGAAALRQSREARPDAARRRAGLGRQRVAAILADHVSAVAPRRLRRCCAGVHPGARHLRDSRHPGRTRRQPDRQRDQAAVPRDPRLAVRQRPVDRAHRRGALPCRPRGMVGRRNLGNPSSARTPMRKRSVGLYAAAAAGYLFLYVPLAIVVAYSFNNSRLNAEWVGFTLDWYDKLFHNEEMLTAAGNSLAIALTASLVATLLGTMAGVAMYRYKLRLLPILVLTPIAIPEILMGVSLLIFFVLLNFTLGLVSVALAHIAFLHRVRRHRRALAPGRHGREPDRGRARLRRDAVRGVPLRHAAAHHARRDRRRADGLHAVDRRLRHHVLHRRRRHGDAAAADLLDDQDRGDSRGQRGVDAVDAAHTRAYHHRFQDLPESPHRRPGATMKRFLLLLASLVIALPASAAKDEFHLYNWNNYLAPETVKRFEEFCKCTVVQTYYSDNEELLAKLSAGAKGYDMYVPTSNAAQALIKSGRLKPIDHAQVPNLKNIESIYLNTPFDPGNKYSSRTRCRRRSSATTTRRSKSWASPPTRGP